MLEVLVEHAEKNHVLYPVSLNVSYSFFSKFMPPTKSDLRSWSNASTYLPINHRVTYSKSPNNARSESSIAINPRNPYNMVAGSKRFTDPAKYEFSLAVYTTFDGGDTWLETADLKIPSEWKASGTSDPALAWDVSSHDGQDIVYLVALPFSPDPGPIIGIAVYQYNDGGRTWGTPKLIHKSLDPDHNREDDKQ